MYLVSSLYEACMIQRIVDYFRIRKQILAQQVGIFIALLIFGGTFAIISPAFRNFTNLQNVAVNISFTLIVAFPLNLLMISERIFVLLFFLCLSYSQSILVFKKDPQLIDITRRSLILVWRRQSRHPRDFGGCLNRH